MNEPAREPRPRLATHILVVYLLLSLGPIVLIVNAYFNESGQLLRQETIHRLDAIADHTARHIESYARQRMRETTLIAHVPIVKQAARDIIRVYEEEGIDSAGYRRMVEKYRPLLSPFLASIESFDVHLVSPEGTLVFLLAQDNELGIDLTGPNFRHTGMGEVFQRAKNLLSTSISPLTKYTDEEPFLFSIGVPILEQGRFLGALILEERADELFETATDYRGLGKSGEMVFGIRDGDDALIVTPLRWKEGAPLDHRFSLTANIGIPLKKALFGDHDHGIGQDYRGQPVLAAWRYLPTMRMGLVIKMDLAEAQAGIHHLAEKGLVLALASAGVIVLITILITRGITTPLAAVARAAREMATGGSGRHVPETGSLETADLARAFNDMSRQISQARGNLERNLTEKTRLLEKLRENEHRFQTLAQNAPVGIFRTDARGNRTFTNHKWRRLTGLTGEDSLRDDWMKHIHPEHRLRVRNNWNRALSDQIPFTDEFSFEHPDGSQVWVMAQVSPEQSRRNVIRSHIGTLTDITEAKRVEALTREVLEAESANKAKSAFLATMSHEIRTPLNGVIGMTELLLETPLNDAQHHYARTIHLSGQSLLALINDILDFSKIEAGHLELERIDLDLRAVVEEVMESMALAAHEKQLELTLRFHPPDMTTHMIGDPGRLRQILINLLGNAIKFTATGSIATEIRLLEKLENGNDRIRFEVRDTGIGISPADQKKLFRPFTQADASTTRQFGGTGLGLSIFERLVTLMKGELGLESSLGKGSLFWFELPFMPGGPTGNVDDRPLAASLEHRRILIVDDHPPNRHILKEQVHLFDAYPELVENGPQALTQLDDALKGKRPLPDAILLDFMMPGMNGLQVAHNLSLDETLKRIPILILSSAGNLPEIQKQGSDNIVQVLPKPTRLSLLLHALLRAISRPDADEKTPLAGTAAPPTAATPPQRSRAPIGTARDPAMETSAKPFPGLHILVAEDNAINRDVIQAMLTGLGCRVNLVNNGHKAVQAVLQGGVDLVLMDCNMPVLDGFDATTQIRRAEKRSAADKRLPIIAVTADALTEDRQRCLAAGMDDHLAKPIRRNRLIRAIRRWTGDRFADPPPDTPEDPATGTAGSPPSLEILNPKTLQQLRQEMGGDIGFVFERFLKGLPKRLTALRTAVAEKDFAALKSAAHQLKGTAMTIGADRLGQQALALETLGRQGEVPEGEKALEPLESAIRETEPAIQKMLETC